MKISFFSCLVLILFLVQTNVSFAQFDILGKIKEKVEQKANEKTDEAIDKGAEVIEKKATEKKQDEGEDEVQKTEQKTEKSVASGNEEKQKAAEEGLKSFSKYDFVPGEKVLFYEDFSQDNVGDFPAKWNTNATGEVVTINKYPGKWLKAKNACLYVPDFPKPFPENYTIEFDMIFNGTTEGSYLGNVNFMLIASANSDEYLKHPYTHHGVSPVNAAIEVALSNDVASRFTASCVNNDSEPVNTDLSNDILKGKYGKIVRVSISAQKQRFRVWVDGRKIYDLPKFLYPATYDIFKIGLWYFDDQNPDTYEVLFSNLRFAVGLPDMRNKLLTDGRLVTHGINFDVNSDKIKPESYGTLKEIASVLKDNPTVKVKIVGHTDSDGQDAANMELSKKRSAAVKNALAAEFGIDTSRMDTDGKGESEPIADNNTIEGKANNRRVEFIKL